MTIEFRKQPVIIMGMHRSGTTMLAKLLDQLGLFLGCELEKNHEAVYFLHLNNLLLGQAKASWDNPTPIRNFLKNSEVVEMTVRCLRGDLLSWKIHRYLGLSQYLMYRSLRRFDRPWGWKDPRNVFTLPLWLKIFAGARIIYILRNGVDVANSLLVREQKYLAWQKARLEKKFDRLSRRTKLERVGFRGSVQCLSLSGCFSLWEQYVAQAEETLALIENDRIVIKYEEFLEDPVSHLWELTRFCGLTGASKKAIAEAARSVNVERANAFISDPVLNSFYREVETTRWMVRYGYSGLLSPWAVSWANLKLPSARSKAAVK